MFTRILHFGKYFCKNNSKPENRSVIILLPLYLIHLSHGPISYYVINTQTSYDNNIMSVISGPFLCFECSKPKEIMVNVYRLYKNKQEAHERIKKIRKVGYKNVSAIDLGDDGIRVQEICCHDCILNWKSLT